MLDVALCDMQWEIKVSFSYLFLNEALYTVWNYETTEREETSWTISNSLRNLYHVPDGCPFSPCVSICRNLELTSGQSNPFHYGAALMVIKLL